MNGVLNTGLEFWQFIVGLLTLVFSFAIVRISFQFDINQYLESRRKLLAQKLKNACTHVQIKVVEEGKVEGRSMFISPPGTIQWQCQRCGAVTHKQGDEFERELKYYLEHIDEYQKKNKKFSRLLKKSGHT